MKLNIFLEHPKYKSLNENINFIKNFIYIAVPKTGSTSIRNQLSNNSTFFISNPHLTLNQTKDLIYPYLLSCNLGRNRNFPITQNSPPSDFELRQLSSELFKRMFKFGSVRNPWARVYSLYTRKEAIQCKQNISFSLFLENLRYANDTCLHPLRTLNQIDWFLDSNGKNIANYIYKLEDLNKAINEIKDLTNGRIILKNKNLNVNNQTNDYRKYYDEEGKNIVAKLFEKDIDFFKYLF